MGTDRRQRFRQIAAAFANRKYLYRVSDVIGMAVGFRERNGKLTEEEALIVYVRPGRKKRAKDDYPHHQQIPERVWIERRGKRIWLPVDIVESPLGRLQAAVRCGDSVGNRLLEKVSGTAGWIARRQSDGAPVICTNYHVLLPMKSQGTDPVLVYPHPSLDSVTAIAPSLLKGGDPNTSIIGSVVGGRRDRIVDAAIVEIDTSLTPEPHVIGIGKYGPARFITSDDLDEVVTVQLRGSVSTTPKQGRVIRYPGEISFRYPDRVAPLLMLDLIVTDIRTREGDSGSVLLDSQQRPMGILLGAAGNRSFFIHIRNVMKRMQLRDF